MTKDTESIQLNSPDLIKTLFHGDYVSITEDHKVINLKKDVSFKFIVGELELYSKYSFKPNKKNVPGYIFRPLDHKYPKFCSSY